MRGDTLVFLIQVGLQGEQAELLRQGLKALCYNASLQLVASQLREDRPSRSNLANMALSFMLAMAHYALTQVGARLYVMPDLSIALCSANDLDC
eukprot:s1810_g9.t1